jgi:NDP-sugar pyrophosphorylase family protein
MKAIILAEHAEFDLSVLTDRVPHALLPMAGKTLLMHAMEALLRSNIQQIDVVAPTLHERLEADIDTAPLAGMEVRFLPETQGTERAEEQLLLVGLTHFPDVEWGQEQLHLGNLLTQCLLPIRLVVNAVPVALLIPPGVGGAVSNSWSDIHRTDAIQHSIGPQNILATGEIKSFYNSSLKLLKDEYRYLKPAGRKCASGHRASPRARIDTRSLTSEFGYFGSNCRIDKMARISGSVVVGDRAVIAGGAHIRDSIIFDRTHIGANVECSRSIVDRDLLINVDTGTCLRLDDPIPLGTAA